MKKIKLNLLCLLGLTLVLSSCTSDLEVVPKDDDIFTSEAFFAQPGAYKKALAAGASSMMEPNDRGYGRTCGITDPFGNVWWLTGSLK